MQSILAFSALLTVAVWVTDGINHKDTVVWQSPPMFQYMR